MIMGLFKVGGAQKCIIRRRINRFVVEVEINDSIELVHINNTGKLQQWLRPNKIGFCYPINGKKHRYRLFAVEYKDLAVVIDTYLHMKSFEYLIDKKIILDGCNIVKRNINFHGALFDYLLDCGVVEIKSATLKNGDFAEYPDTYTKRGEKHIRILKSLSQNGYNAYLVFVSGIPDVSKFRINEKYGWAISRLLESSNINLLSYSIGYDHSTQYIKYIRRLHILI